MRAGLPRVVLSFEKEMKRHFLKNGKRLGIRMTLQPGSHCFMRIINSNFIPTGRS